MLALSHMLYDVDIKKEVKSKREQIQLNNFSEKEIKEENTKKKEVEISLKETRNFVDDELEEIEGDDSSDSESFNIKI